MEGGYSGHDSARRRLKVWQHWNLKRVTIDNEFRYTQCQMDSNSGGMAYRQRRYIVSVFQKLSLQKCDSALPGGYEEESSGKSRREGH